MFSNCDREYSAIVKELKLGDRTLSEVPKFAFYPLYTGGERGFDLGL
jgi:hypothetical protein